MRSSIKAVFGGVTGVGVIGGFGAGVGVVVTGCVTGLGAGDGVTGCVTGLGAGAEGVTTGCVTGLGAGDAGTGDAGGVDVLGRITCLGPAGVFTVTTFSAGVIVEPDGGAPDPADVESSAARS